MCSLAFTVVLILAGHDTALQLPFAQVILLVNSCALEENHHLRISPLKASQNATAEDNAALRTISKEWNRDFEEKKPLYFLLLYL